MLSENTKNLRKAKGISQEESAIKLNVVRQTISSGRKEFPINKDTGINPQTYIAYEK